MGFDARAASRGFLSALNRSKQQLQERRHANAISEQEFAREFALKKYDQGFDRDKLQAETILQLLDIKTDAESGEADRENRVFLENLIQNSQNLRTLSNILSKEGIAEDRNESLEERNKATNRSRESVANLRAGASIARGGIAADARIRSAEITAGAGRQRILTGILGRNLEHINPKLATTLSETLGPQTSEVLLNLAVAAQQIPEGGQGAKTKELINLAAVDLFLEKGGEDLVNNQLMEYAKQKLAATKNKDISEIKDTDITENTINKLGGSELLRGQMMGDPIHRKKIMDSFSAAVTELSESGIINISDPDALMADLIGSQEVLAPDISDIPPDLLDYSDQILVNVPADQKEQFRVQILDEFEKLYAEYGDWNMVYRIFDRSIRNQGTETPAQEITTPQRIQR